MKYELIIDRNISVWSREKVIVESDSLENAINSALEEDENTRIINYEYIPETEEYIGPTEVFDEHYNQLC